MIPFLQDYAERLTALHADLQKACSDLPDQALDWSPGPALNSPGVLLAHTAGAERYWLGDVIGRGTSERQRSAEFHVHGLSAAQLIALLDQVLADSLATLEQLGLADLEAERVSPRDGRRCTVAWALAHALEHTALHLGHLQITRQLWDQRSAG